MVHDCQMTLDIGTLGLVLQLVWMWRHAIILLSLFSFFTIGHPQFEVICPVLTGRAINCTLNVTAYASYDNEDMQMAVLSDAALVVAYPSFCTDASAGQTLLECDLTNNRTSTFDVALQPKKGFVGHTQICWCVTLAAVNSSSRKCTSTIVLGPQSYGPTNIIIHQANQFHIHGYFGFVSCLVVCDATSFFVSLDLKKGLLVAPSNRSYGTHLWLVSSMLDTRRGTRDWQRVYWLGLHQGSLSTSDC